MATYLSSEEIYDELVTQDHILKYKPKDRDKYSEVLRAVSEYLYHCEPKDRKSILTRMRLRVRSGFVKSSIEAVKDRLPQELRLQCLKV